MTICMQLYSARNFPPVETQLAAIEANGFDGVETFGPFHDDAAATRRLLDAHGLAAKSAHIDLATFETRPERAIAIARALGAELVVAPYLTPSERPTSRDGWRDLGARLERVRARIAGDGLRFAWHNHDFEFISLPDGSFPIEHLLGDAVSWEADLAWIARGGGNPLRWLERYRGRVAAVHVKDIAPTGEKADEEGWADVGAGVLPWPDLWARSVAAGATIMIAEHDNPSDFARFARVSAAAMRRLEAGTR